MPTSESPNVPISKDIYAGEAAAQQRLARSVQQAGGALGDIALDMRQADIDRELNNFQAKVNETNVNDELFYESNNDEVIREGENGKPAYTKYQEQHEKSMKFLTEEAGKLKYGQARERASQFLLENKPFYQHKTNQYIKREEVERISAGSLDLIESLISTSQTIPADRENSIREQKGEEPLTENEFRIAQIKVIAEKNVKSNIWHADDAQRIVQKAEADIHKLDIENVKGQWQSMVDTVSAIPNVSESDMKKVHDDARQFIIDQKEAGILSPDDAGTQIGNLNNYIAGQIRQNEDIKKATDLQKTKGFVDKILNPKPNEFLTADDVQNAYPNKNDKKIRDTWVSIIEGSYSKDLPTETTVEGQAQVMTILSNASKGTQTTNGAYKDLFLERYGGTNEDGVEVTPTISDKTFRWALEKIEKPLPIHITTQLQATMESAKTAIYKAENSFWYTGTEKARVETASQKFNDEILANISDGLLDWVDGQIKSGKVPTPDEIHIMAAKIGVGARTAAQAKQAEQTKPIADFDTYYDNLPSGAEFTAPDGTRRRKP